MIEYQDSSIHVKDSILWLDATKKKGLSFVSHAHSEQMSVDHDKIIATKETIEFYKKIILKGKPLNALQMSYFRTFSIGDLTLTLYPSGHTPGAAQLLIKKNETKILYSSHINIQNNMLCDEIYFPKADELIMDSVYGNIKYQFPEKEKEEENFKNYVSEQIKKGFFIIILANPYGKSQYIIKLLEKLNISIYLQNKIYQHTQLFKIFGINFTNIKPFINTIKEPSVILHPYENINKILMEKKNIKIISLSGLSVDKDYFHKLYNLDESFILSDNSDFNGLLQYIKIIKPSKIYLLPGRNSLSFREILKDLKYNVEEFVTSKPKSLF